MTNERWKPSVTVAALIERQGRDGPQFLLVEEETPEGLRLNNPAGHLDPGESPQQAVVREALEETGRVFTPAHLVGVYMTRFRRPATGEDVTYLRMAFAGSASEPARGWVLDHGIVGTHWMGLAELQTTRARHRSPLVLRCVQDHLAGRRYPLDLLVVDPTVYEPEIKS